METIRVGMFVHPPCVMADWKTNSRPGVQIELLSYFCNALKIICDLQTLPTNEYGYYKNGTWHGLLRYVVDNLTDVTFPRFTPTSERYEVVDFSANVWYNTRVLATRAPTEPAITMWSFVEFHWSVWACICITTITIGIFLTLVESGYLAPNDLTRGTITRCMDSFAVLINQGFSIRILKVSSRFILAFWMSATVIMGGAYSARLLSSLILQTRKLPFTDFNSFVDCVETKKCTLAVDNFGAASYQEILKSDEVRFQRLRKALITNPTILSNNIPNLVNNILNTQSTFIAWYGVHTDYSYWTNGNRLCNFYTVNVATLPAVFAMTKHFSLAEKLNIEILKANAMGISDQILRKYSSSNGTCDVKHIERQVPLTIYSIVGMLVLFSCGILFSLAVLLIEKCATSVLYFHIYVDTAGVKCTKA